MIWEENNDPHYEARGLPDNHHVHVLPPMSERDNWCWEVSVIGEAPEIHIIMAGVSASHEAARVNAECAYQRASKAFDLLRE
jgi:hypothetical protein